MSAVWPQWASEVGPGPPVAVLCEGRGSESVSDKSSLHCISQPHSQQGRPVCSTALLSEGVVGAEL